MPMKRRFDSHSAALVCLIVEELKDKVVALDLLKDALEERVADRACELRRIDPRIRRGKPAEPGTRARSRKRA